MAGMFSEHTHCDRNWFVINWSLLRLKAVVCLYFLNPQPLSPWGNKQVILSKQYEWRHTLCDGKDLACAFSSKAQTVTAAVTAAPRKQVYMDEEQHIRLLQEARLKLLITKWDFKRKAFSCLYSILSIQHKTGFKAWLINLRYFSYWDHKHAVCSFLASGCRNPQLGCFND